MENEYLPIIRESKNIYYVLINGNREYLRLDTIGYKKRRRKSKSIDNGYIRKGMLSSSEIEDRIGKEKTGYFVNVNELNTHLISTSKNVPDEIQDILFSYLKPPSFDRGSPPIYKSRSASSRIVSPRSPSSSPTIRSLELQSLIKNEEKAGETIKKFMKQLKFMKRMKQLKEKRSKANKSRGGKKSRTKRGTRRK
jgi:hypothetical protein